MHNTNYNFFKIYYLTTETKDSQQKNKPDLLFAPFVY